MELYVKFSHDKWYCYYQLGFALFSIMLSMEIIGIPLLNTSANLFFCHISGMGNTESAKKRQQRKELLKQMEKDSKKTTPFYSKKLLFLHKSTSTQLRVVENFIDALITRTEGTIDVKNDVNIADENEIPKTREWLEEKNNIVLLCLTSDSIGQLHKIIVEKEFADENGNLHPKVFSVTFGEKLTAQWPPRGLKKGSSDLRDFHFGFTDVEKLTQEDFEQSLRLNSLIAAMKATL